MQRPNLELHQDSRHTICKEHENNEKAEPMHGDEKRKMKNLGRTLTKSQKSYCKTARRAGMILGFSKEFNKTRQQN